MKSAPRKDLRESDLLLEQIIRQAISSYLQNFEGIAGLAAQELKMMENIKAILL